MGMQPPEVKIPSVPLTLVEAIEFRSPEMLEAFARSHPNLAGRCCLYQAPEPFNADC